jgi:hypothetical protein
MTDATTLKNIEKEARKQVRSGLIWPQRHLNITLLSAWLAQVAAVVFLRIDGLWISLFLIIPVAFWYLNEKGKSLKWVLISWMTFSLIIFLMLSNDKEKKKVDEIVNQKLADASR